MHRSIVKRARIAAMLIPVLALASSAWGQVQGYAGGVPWQTGDIVACFGTSSGFGGACNVLRIVNGTAVLLDQFTDNLGGSTFGVAINNTLHVVATDDAGGSKVVVYSVASLNPNTSPASPIAHTRVYTYNSSGGNGANVRAVAINNSGNMFVLNSTGGDGSPSIVEIGPGPAQTAVATFSLSSCKDSLGNTLNQATSMDLSADGSIAYVTSGGTIQKVTFSPLTCAKFADFGTGVTLYGVKDIAASALPASCGSSITSPPVPCGNDETLLVVAMGNTDPDNTTGETENGSPDPDAVNVCTNQLLINSSPVSCALLLDTNPNPGLTTPLWQAGKVYNLPSSILDPNVKLQTAVTAGTSGADEPKFDETGATAVIDNAVKWTDIVQPTRTNDTPYSNVGTTPAPITAAVAGTFFVDPNGNLETVTGTGTSGHFAPGFTGNPSPNNPVSWSTSGGTTIDGLQWQDQGTWQVGHTFQLGASIGDAGGHPQTVYTAGTSGASIPNFSNVTGAITPDNAVIWTNQGPVKPYTGGGQYALNTLIAPNGHAQQAVEPGTSGGTTPPFSVSGGSTIDNAVTWADLGPAVWHPSFSYGPTAIIVDGNGHVQQVTTGGTSGPGPQPSFSSSPTIDGLQWSLVTPGPNGPLFPDWAPSTAYCSTCTAGVSFQDPTTTDVWQATTPGTSGGTRPTFYVSGNPATQPIADNAVVWTDEGLLSVFNWQPNNPYALNTEIVDQSNHVQLVAIPGTSGPAQPNFNLTDGGTTVDGTAGTAVTWTNLGQAVWRPSFSYGLNAIIVDSGGHVQQVTTAGTTGSGSPIFTHVTTSTTPDGSVVWTDEGPLSGTTFTWKNGTTYSLNAMIVDPANQVELVTTTGTSGGSQPTFADGANVVDGLVWLDIGPVVAWASRSFSTGELVIDPGTFLQKVTTAGISGTPAQPTWNDNPLGTTIDGLQWKDYGPSAWTAGNQYFTGTLISEPTSPAPGPYHAQKVYEAGTSGGGPAPSFNHAFGLTLDNAVTWTESQPSRATSTAYVLNAIVLNSPNTPGAHVERVSLAGATGPAAMATPFSTSGGTVIDGLQWQIQNTPPTSVIARYPVNGTTTLTSLALDPLIVDCIAGCNYPLPPLKISSVITSPGVNNPTLGSPGFWLGDSGFPNFYKLDFATGTPTQFLANGPINIAGTQFCTNCATITGIQGVGIYGSEGANQPGLAKLLFNNRSTAPNNETAFFPSSSADATLVRNSVTATLYNSSIPAGALGPFAIYASAVAPGSCFSDLPGKPPCAPTFKPVAASPALPIMWKDDIPLPSSGSLTLSSTQTFSGNFDFPTNFQSTSNEVALDSQFDTTTLTGLDLPGFTKPSTVHAYKLISGNGQSEGDYGCSYSSPVISPSNACYPGPTTIPIKFSCSQLIGNQLGNYGVTKSTPWGPRLKIVQFGPPPIPKNLQNLPNPLPTGGAPNEANASTAAHVAFPPGVILAPQDPATQLQSSQGATAYNFKSNGVWMFNWNVTSTSTGQIYEICTYDDSNGSWSKTGVKAIPVCTLPFYVKNTCP